MEDLNSSFFVAFQREKKWFWLSKIWGIDRRPVPTILQQRNGIAHRNEIDNKKNSHPSSKKSGQELLNCNTT